MKKFLAALMILGLAAGAVTLSRDVARADDTVSAGSSGVFILLGLFGGGGGRGSFPAVSGS